MQLAKLDIESAYWLIPVHADDSPLLGMRWRGKTYIDSRSAPKVFNAVADAMQWISEQHGAALLGRLPRHRCPKHKGVQAGVGNSTIGLCRRLGIPISVHKTV